MLDGKDGDDELEGGAGDDILKGGDTGTTSSIYQEILRGGSGNDVMYGGSSSTDLGGIPTTVDRTASNFVGRLYMYGDEGDDELWGKHRM